MLANWARNPWLKCSFRCMRKQSNNTRGECNTDKEILEELYEEDLKISDFVFGIFQSVMRTSGIFSHETTPIGGTFYCIIIVNYDRCTMQPGYKRFCFN